MARLFAPIFDRTTRGRPAGRARVFDDTFIERLWRTVKYEDIYLKDYESVAELDAGLVRYFRFYNEERPTSRSTTARQRQCIGRSTLTTGQQACQRINTMAGIPAMSQLDELDIATLEKALATFKQELDQMRAKQKEQDAEITDEDFQRIRDVVIRKANISQSNADLCLVLWNLASFGELARQIEERGQFNPDAPKEDT